MPELPDASQVFNSNDFSVWAREMEQYIALFEQVIAQKVAWQQTKKYAFRPVLQTVINRKDLGFQQIGAEGFFEMKLDDLDVPGENLLFLPLSNDTIEELCRKNHIYFDSESSERHIFRFQRVESFVDQEEIFRLSNAVSSSLNAKSRFLPNLSFPFLPYSRKFVRIVDEEGKTLTLSRQLPKPLIASNITFEGVDLETGQIIRSAFNAEIVPVWNVSTNSKMVQSWVELVKHKDTRGHKWRIEEGSFNETVDYTILEVLHRNKPVLGTPEITAEYVFHKDPFDRVRFSQVHDVPEKLSNPPFRQWVSGKSNQSIDRTSAYWYRQFIQSFQFTESDILQYLSMIEDAREVLRYDHIRTEKLSDKTLDASQELSLKFSNPLWYLRANQGGVDGSLGAFTEVQIVFSLNKESANSSGLPGYIIQDLVNYFCALCGLKLPYGVRCKGVIDS